MSELDPTEFTTTEPKPEREGLPRGYKMRADAHYVESLTSASASREPRAREMARATAGDHGASALREDSRITNDRRLFDQLAEDVAAIESAAAILMADQSPLSRRVGLDLIKAQSARAAWLLRATALLGGADLDATPRRKPVAAILREVRDRAMVECRLVGVGLEIDPVEPVDLSVNADSALAIGLTGAVLAQLGLVSGNDLPVIRLRALATRGELAGFEISQDAVALPGALHGRFFDSSWTGRPGGWVAGLGAATVKTAADRLGGSVALVTRDGRGCAIRWSWPSESAQNERSPQ